MKSTLYCILFICCACLLFASESIEIKYGDWQDKDRDRIIPYKVYYPQPLVGDFPVVLFSHGLGGSREAAAYLGKYLAKNGYIVFHIQHPGSDASVWKDQGRGSALKALTRSLSKPQNALNRFKDIPFVIDQLEEMQESSDIFQGHFDLNRIGMAGHSYGGRSTLVAAGERLSRRLISFKEPRLAAGVVLSPNLPRANADLEKAYEEIDIPLFHITGTQDKSPLPNERDMDPIQRTKPYEHIDSSPQYLLVLDQADHMTFSGRRLESRHEKELDKQHIKAVQTGVLAFFDAYLKKDDRSKEWLLNQFKQTLDNKDRFVWKN
jgi:predicted dienelactone hydrolase